MAEVRAIDCTDLTKVLVRADPGGALAAALEVPFGHAARDGEGVLVVRTAPDAWLLLAPAGPATPLVRRVEALGAGEFASVVDVTHGHALARLTGTAAPDVLAKLCAIDLSEATTPGGTAFRSLVAGIAATVIRDAGPGRLTAGSAGATPAGGRDAGRSYLVLCDRSYRRYLRDVLTDAGDEFGLAWT